MHIFRGKYFVLTKICVNMNLFIKNCTYYIVTVLLYVNERLDKFYVEYIYRIMTKKDLDLKGLQIHHFKGMCMEGIYNIKIK